MKHSFKELHSPLSASKLRQIPPKLDNKVTYFCVTLIEYLVMVTYIQNSKCKIHLYRFKYDKTEQLENLLERENQGRNDKIGNKLEIQYMYNYLRTEQYFRAKLNWKSKHVFSLKQSFENVLCSLLFSFWSV